MEIITLAVHVTLAGAKFYCILMSNDIFMVQFIGFLDRHFFFGAVLFIKHLLQIIITYKYQHVDRDYFSLWTFLYTRSI